MAEEAHHGEVTRGKPLAKGPVLPEVDSHAGEDISGAAAARHVVCRGQPAQVPLGRDRAYAQACEAGSVEDRKSCP